MPTQARIAVASLGILALIAPATLRAQGLGSGASALPSGPSLMIGRAGVGPLMFSPVTIVPTMIGNKQRAGFTQRDTSSHHGSRTHHAAVGALIGGAVGLVLGVASDRVWFGSGEGRGHFQNLWHITVPLGALVGSLAGTLRPAD